MHSTCRKRETTMIDLNPTAAAVFKFIVNSQGKTEQEVSKRFFNRRVLPARQSCQYLLWSGLITSRGGKYVAIGG